MHEAGILSSPKMTAYQRAGTIPTGYEKSPSYGGRPAVVPGKSQPSLRLVQVMSALGQKQTFEGASGMSALPPKADINPDAAHVCFQA
jgi:hypothetical protein